jgi:hypothetical protein
MSRAMVLLKTGSTHLEYSRNDRSLSTVSFQRRWLVTVAGNF